MVRDCLDGEPLDAARDGRSEVVAQLLLESARVDAVDELGETPLFVAASKGNVNIVAQLLAFEGVDVNKAKEDGTTPLYIAAQKGNVNIVAQLLAFEGVDVNKATVDDTSPIFIAAQEGLTPGPRPRTGRQPRSCFGSS
jgi:ankyrin repeat protein